MKTFWNAVINHVSTVSIIIILLSGIMGTIAGIRLSSLYQPRPGKLTPIETTFTITKTNAGESIPSDSVTVDTLPYSFPGNQGDVISCSFRLNVTKGAHLLFRGSHQKIRVFMGGVEIFKFGYENEPYVGQTPGSKWVNLGIDADDTTDIEIFFETVYPQYNDTIPVLYIGTQEEITHFLMRQFPYILVDIGSLMVGVLVFLIGAVLRFKNNPGKRIIYASLSVVSISLWLFFENRSVQFFFNNPALVVRMVFLVFPMIPVYVTGFLRSFDSLVKDRFVIACSYVSFINFIAVQLLQFFDILDYVNSDFLTFAVDLLVALCMLYTFVLNKNKFKDLNPLFYLLCAIFIILGLIDGVKYFTGNSDSYNLLGLSQIGFSLLIAILSIWTIQTAIHENQRLMQRELYKKLAYTDLMTQLSNRTAYEEIMEYYRKNLMRPAVAVIDINSLKLINDKYGHKSGDDAIQRVAGVLKEHQDGLTRAFRIGGDEFCLFRSDGDTEQMRALVQEIQQKIKAMASEISYPFSIAVGCSDKEGDSIDQDFSRADKLMYEDKNRIHAMQSGL